MPENVEAANTSELAETTVAGDEKKRQGFVAAGGILGAVAASSCCILPLALTLAGISGAWMANIRALAPYQPIFIALTIAALVYGFYLVYWKPKKACADGKCTQPPVPNGIVKAALWFASFIVLLAITFAYWFPLIVPYLP